MAANPWGLAAIAIGGIVTAVTLLGDETSDSEREVKEFVDGINESTSKLKSSIDDSNELQKSIADTKDNILAEMGSVQMLTDELFKLEGQSNKTTGEKALMLEMVTQLNDLVPDLALAYDGETDSLSLQKDEIYRVIEAKKAQYMVEAARESLIDIGKQLYESEKILAEAQIESKTITDELAVARGEYAHANKEYAEIGRDGAVVTREEELRAADLSVELQNLTNKISDGETAQKKNNGTIKDAQTEITELSTDYQYAQGYIADHTAIDNTTGAIVYMGDSATTAKDKVTNFANSVNAAPSMINIAAWNKLGGDIVSGIESGFIKGVPTLKSKMGGALTDVEMYLRGPKVINSNSPSKKYAKMGIDMADGVGVGWSDEMELVSKKMGNSFSTDYNLSSSVNANSIHDRQYCKCDNVGIFSIKFNRTNGQRCNGKK